MANRFKTCTVDDLNSLLSVQDSLLLDCRKVSDYKAGHIDNAMHAHDDLVEILVRNSDKQRNIVIYCYHGHSSEHLAELFSNFGFTSVFSLEGGYDKWSSTQMAS